MGPPGSDDSDARPPDTPSVPELRPEWLRTLHEYQQKLSGVLEEIALQPDQLDASAVDVHEIVEEIVRLLRTQVTTTASARGWGDENQLQFLAAFEAVADLWTVYRPALMELKAIEERRGSVVEAKENLRIPRRQYIRALGGFGEQLLVALGGLEPA